jgi:biotin carboxyl carrier protein
MNPNHKVIVDDKYEFTFSEEDIANASIIETPKGLHMLTTDEKSLEVQWKKKDLVNRQYTPQVDGNLFEVRIETPLEQQISSMGFSLDSKQTVSQIIAPMPGLILDVQVKEGDEVVENDLLLILEAMKMENAVKSPRSGKIKSINVNKGDAVEKKHLLIEFEN